MIRWRHSHSEVHVANRSQAGDLPLVIQDILTFRHGIAQMDVCSFADAIRTIHTKQVNPVSQNIYSVTTTHLFDSRSWYRVSASRITSEVIPAENFTLLTTEVNFYQVYKLKANTITMILVVTTIRTLVN